MPVASPRKSFTSNLATGRYPDGHAPSTQPPARFLGSSSISGGYAAKHFGTTRQHSTIGAVAASVPSTSSAIYDGDAGPAAAAAAAAGSGSTRRMAADWHLKQRQQQYHTGADNANTISNGVASPVNTKGVGWGGAAPAQKRGDRNETAGLATPLPPQPPQVHASEQHDVTTVMLSSSQELVTSTNTGTTVLRQQLGGAQRSKNNSSATPVRAEGASPTGVIAGSHLGYGDQKEAALHQGAGQQRPILRGGARTPSPNRVVLIDAGDVDTMHGNAFGTVRAASAQQRRQSPTPYLQQKSSSTLISYGSPQSHRQEDDERFSTKKGSILHAVERVDIGTNRDRFSGRPRKQSPPHAAAAMPNQSIGHSDRTTSTAPLSRNSAAALLGPPERTPQQPTQQHHNHNHSYPTTLAHAWEKLCTAAQRDFTPADLRLVSCDTLRAIMEHYDITAPEEVAHIEAQWALLQEEEDATAMMGVSFLLAAAVAAPRGTAPLRRGTGGKVAPAARGVSTTSSMNQSSTSLRTASPVPAAALRLGEMMVHGGISGVAPPQPAIVGRSAASPPSSQQHYHPRSGGGVVAASASGAGVSVPQHHHHPPSTTRSHSLTSGGTLTYGGWSSSERRRSSSGELDTTLAPSLKPKCVLKGHRTLLAQEVPGMSNPNLAVSPQGVDRPRGIRSGIAPPLSKDLHGRVVPYLAPRDSLQGGTLRDGCDTAPSPSPRRLSRSVTSLDDHLSRPKSTARSKINDGQLTSLA